MIALVGLVLFVASMWVSFALFGPVGLACMALFWIWGTK
jgi:hypothetical protein